MCHWHPSLRMHLWKSLLAFTRMPRDTYRSCIRFIGCVRFINVQIAFISNLVVCLSSLSFKIDCVSMYLLYEVYTTAVQRERVGGWAYLFF